MLVAGDVALGRRKLLLRRVWRATMVDDVASIISCMTQSAGYNESYGYIWRCIRCILYNDDNAQQEVMDTGR